jgi:hypothetical protein
MFCLRASYRTLLLALALFGLAGMLETLQAGGFEHRLPVNRVNLLSDRRNNVFYVGERIFFPIEYQQAYPNAATRYTIRDYQGDLVESGPITGPFIAPTATKPGWYKINLHGNPIYQRQNGDPSFEPEWADNVGGTMFVIFRNNPNFPTIPSTSTTAGTEALSDNVMRGIVGSGPQRHRLYANSDWQTAVNYRAQDIAQEKTFYTPYDPYRNRVLLGAFPDGTSNPNGTASVNYVTPVVQAFQNDVKYWEPRNEPNYANNGLNGTAQSFATNEFIPFSDAVKGVNSTLKVIGPGNVEIRPGSHGLGFMQDFLATMQSQNALHKLDGISFHVYNSFNGDPFMARKSMEALVNVLNQYGQQNKDRWQTEQGFAAAINGSYQPRMQTRWTMLMFMVLEQYGVPKEHNYLFYDRNGGFFEVPVWWINMDGTLNPLACLLRVWSEELYGTQFTSAYDFGTTGNKLYLGNLFTGPGKQVAAFMSAGSTDGQVRLQVSAPSVHVVSAFGEERDVAAQNGSILLPVTEIPTYVEFTGSLSVVPQSWGTNLALGKPVTSTVMSHHPSDASIINPTTKVTNGEFENWYYLQTQETKVWVDCSFTFPAWVEIDLQQPTTLDRVVIYSGVPWQWDGTLLDYDLQYDQNGSWVTLQTVQEPTRTMKTFTIANRTSVDSFFSDRWVFSHSFSPVTTRKLRVWVRDVTYGGGANQLVAEIGGQTGLRIINLREVEAYSSGTQDTPNLSPLAGNDSGSTNQEGVEIRVLANDSDADSWPQPLRIASAGPAAHGKVAIVGHRIRYVPEWGYSGPDSFPYTVTDGLATTTATVSMTAIFNNPPKAMGWLNLKAEYFSDQTFSNLVATEYNPGIINYSKEWHQVGPYGMNGQNFGIRWSGQIKAAYTGGYTFTTYSDDRARVWLDGQLIIDDWVPHSPFHARKMIYLDGGRTYNVQVDYTEGGGNSVMQFLWSNPLQSTETFVPLAPMETWRRSTFSQAQLADAAISSPTATPARDGVSNQFKYAFALSPLIAAVNSTALPQAETFLEAGRRYLTLTYRKNAAASDINYAVRVADDLATGIWDDVAPAEEILGYDGANPIVRRRVDVTDSTKKFIRLDLR